MKIICIGDSTTYGQSVRENEAWPAVLSFLTGHDVRNAGVCGDTTRLALERFPKHVQLHSPDAVVIQFGLNDANIWETDNGRPRVSCSAYAANITEMRNRALAAGATKVLVLRPHDPDNGDWNYRLRVRGYRESITGIDPPRSSFVDDGYDLHPDQAMHRRYARLVANAL